MSISNFLELELLDQVFRNAAAPAITTVWMSLHTADPGETGASEVTGGSYARQSTAFDVASAGATANSAVEVFANMPAVTVTHVGCFDASTSGNFLWGGILDSSQVVASGDNVEFAAGALDITLD